MEEGVLVLFTFSLQYDAVLQYEAKLFKNKCPNLTFQVVEFDRMSNNGSLGAYGGASSSMAVDDEVISHFRKEIGLDPSALITPQDRKDHTLKGNNFMFELLDC